jgi:hypothetical protein
LEHEEHEGRKDHEEGMKRQIRRANAATKDVINKDAGKPGSDSPINMREDLAEIRDLAKDKPDQAAKLRDMLHRCPNR